MVFYHKNLHIQHIKPQGVLSMNKKIVFIILSVLFFIQPLFSAQASDIIIVIDQSRSIREAMPAIKDYIKDRIFTDIAKEGDKIHILSFDGHFYEQGIIDAGADKKSIESLLSTVQPVGLYTDLTNAVIEMSKYSIENSRPQSKRIVFFMTDGLNEPPAYSPYRDGLRDSYFEKARKYYKDKGWTLFVTGIGEKTNAPELSQYLKADLIQLSAKPTIDEFDQIVTARLDKARNSSSFPLIPLGIGTAIVIAGSSSLLLLRKHS